MPPSHRPSRTPGARASCRGDRRRASSSALGIGVVCASTGGPSERDAVAALRRARGTGATGRRCAARSPPTRRSRYRPARVRPALRRRGRHGDGLLAEDRPARAKRRRPLAAAGRRCRPARSGPSAATSPSTSSRTATPRASTGRRSSSSPACGAGERLQRTTQMPERADLLARDGTPLAQGADRSSPLGATAQAIVGALGPIPAERKARAAALGYPADAQVGISGLERDLRRAPRRHARRRAARRRPPAGRARAAQGARRCARRSRPRSRRRRSPRWPGASAASSRCGPRPARSSPPPGSRFSGLQPPGSTFKIITLTGALENGAAKPTDSFPVADLGDARGRRAAERQRRVLRRHAGGVLRATRATRSSRRWAPSSARARLVATAERFGFNAPTAITGAATASIPPAGEIGDDLAVGSTRDRPGPRAGHRAADGDRRRDDRRCAAAGRT